MGEPLYNPEVEVTFLTMTQNPSISRKNRLIDLTR